MVLKSIKKTLFRIKKKDKRNEFIETFFFLFVFLFLLITSCSTNDLRPEQIVAQRAAEQKKGDIAISNQKVDAFNSALTKKGIDYRKSLSTGDYIIGPEDLLDINVFQVEELKSEVRVSSQGYIKLPLIDTIKAEGLTVSKLEKLISQKYLKFLEEPVVSVFVKEFRSQQIAVLGAVKDPKVYYITGQRYLLDMLSMAGGLAPEAGNVCIVQRINPKDKTPDESERLVIDMDELLVRGHTELNIPLLSGDVIHVPLSGIFFVDGAVNAPGSFPIKGKTTLTQAISLAKGMSFEAATKDVRIYRDNGKPEREMISVNYKSVLSGKTPDVALNDKDIVIVPKDTVRNLIKGISTSLSFGFFRLGKGF